MIGGGERQKVILVGIDSIGVPKVILVKNLLNYFLVFFLLTFWIRENVGGVGGGLGWDWGWRQWCWYQRVKPQIVPDSRVMKGEYFTYPGTRPAVNTLKLYSIVYFYMMPDASYVPGFSWPLSVFEPLVSTSLVEGGWGWGWGSEVEVWVWVAWIGIGNLDGEPLGLKLE